MNGLKVIRDRWTRAILYIASTVLFFELVIAAPDAARSNTILIKILEEDERPERGKATAFDEYEREDRNVPLTYTRSPPSFKQVEVQKPEIQIYLLKGHVSPDQNWGISTEYRYSGKNYKENRNRYGVDHEFDWNRQRIDEERNETHLPRVDERPAQIPSIGSRNIIDARVPNCPEGHLRDSKGICRPRASRIFARRMGEAE